jgi:tetratricopeptide (TPR) repeat protein
MLAAVDEFRAHGHQPAASQILGQLLGWYEQRPEDDPASVNHWAILGGALARAGRWDEARLLYQELVVAEPETLTGVGSLGVVMARLGARDEASGIDERLAAIDRPYLYGRATLWQARIAAVLGERERAVNLLRNAFAEGLSYGIWLHLDVSFESLQDDPAFHELMRPKG